MMSPKNKEKNGYGYLWLKYGHTHTSKKHRWRLTTAIRWYILSPTHKKTVVAPVELCIKLNIGRRYAIRTSLESWWSCASVHMFSFYGGQFPEEQWRLPIIFGALPPKQSGPRQWRGWWPVFWRVGLRRILIWWTSNIANKKKIFFYYCRNCYE